MDAIEIVFRLVGAFYVFAGWLALRAEGLAIAGALKAILGPENVSFAAGWESGQGADA